MQTRTRPLMLLLAAALLGAAFAAQAADYAGGSYDSTPHPDSGEPVQHAPHHSTRANVPAQTRRPRPNASHAHRTPDRTRERTADRQRSRTSACAFLPGSGETMPTVRAELGEPLSSRGPVGDPPITRWNYAGCHVYFEHNLVIHTVVPGDPVPVFHNKRLGSQP